MKDIIVISGGTKGLGKELIKALVEENKYIICNLSRGEESLSKLKEEISYKDYYDFCGDVSDEKFVIDSVEKISNLGQIRYLINNAGAGAFAKPEKNNRELVEKIFKGFYGMIYLTTAVLNKSDNVKIVNIMSSAALKGNAEESVYCACKWGERGYTESLKLAYKGTNVKVVGVYPGGMNTNFWNENREYVSLEKQNTFMPAKDVAKIIINNVFNELNLTVTDLIIERK